MHISQCWKKSCYFKRLDKNEISLNNSKTSHSLSYYTLCSVLDKDLMMA